MRKMPRYKCHKIVRALQIDEIILHAHPDLSVSLEEFIKSDIFQGGHLLFADREFQAWPFTAGWYRKHNPHKGGYLVEYDDGYMSYSPAKAFEEGYTLMDDDIP